MKKLLCLVPLLFALLIFSSCHSAKQKQSFEMPETFDETKQYEISFWAKNDTNMTQVEIYKKAITDFEKLYPNIKVKLRLYTDYGKIYNDVITNISTDTTPNVCITYPDHIATYITGKDSVVPLENLIDDENYGLGGKKLKFDSPERQEIIPKFLSECEFGSHIYALPFMRSTEACYVNKTYVEKLGYTLPETLTWDFVFEVSRAALEKDENGNFVLNGQKVLIPFIYKSTDNMMIQMLYQKNAPYSTNLGEIKIFNTTTEKILETVAHHSSLGAFNTFKLAGYPANFLNAGQCIFAVDSTAGATWMGSDAPLVDIDEEKLVQFETKVMTVPQYDVNNKKMISQGPSLCVFNKEDRSEVLASWLFCQYMLTNDVQIAYSKTEGYCPVTSKAQESEEYRDYLSREGEDNELYYDIKLKATKLLLENTENTFVTPVFNGSSSLRNAAGGLIENVNKSVRRKQEFNEEYLEELKNEITSLYRLDTVSLTRGKENLGPLPYGSKVLILCVALCWAGIALYVLNQKIKSKKKK